MLKFYPADPISIYIFSFFSILMLSAQYFALKSMQKGKQWFFSLIVVTGVFSVTALTGVTAEKFIPFGPILILFMLGFSIAFAVSNTGKNVADALPFSILIGFQAFRFPLELILHHWAQIGTIPETMTWTGQNWDIISGISALISIPLVKKYRLIAMGVNLVGFLLLMNVFRVVIMSAPLPFAWNLERPLLLIAYFPYCLIGPLFVLPAFVGHLVTFRKLWNSR